MGLRCLIGHDFGDLQSDRDRRERGDEVVVTVREYRECSRCGETRVVSENTEVRSTAPADDTPADETASAASKGVEDVDAETDDGVILEEGPEDTEERGRGEWPTSETGPPETESEPAPWPEVDDEDEGYAAEPADGSPAEGVDFGGGLTPEAEPTGGAGPPTDDDEEDVVEADEGAGFRRASTGPSPTSQQRTTSPDSEFYCPECEYTTPTANSSLRPGDICPECRLGYLTERDRSSGR